MCRPISEFLRNRTLKTRGDVRRQLSRQCARAMPSYLVRYSRLQARETEIAPGAAQHRPGKCVTPRISINRQLFERRSTRPAQPEQFRHLVERLPRGIIESAAQPDMLPDPLNRDTLAMPTGYKHEQIREAHSARHKSRQARGKRVSFQVVHRDKWQFMCDRDSLGELAANNQPTDQARTGRRHHTTEFTELQSGASHDTLHLPREIREMGTRGDLRHHAAIWRVLALLAQQRLSKDSPVSI
jgi:hypothetical protein